MAEAEASIPVGDFPLDDSLCEQCGYSLRGLSAGAGCPECGLVIAASHPSHRDGLPWQRGMNIRNWIATWRAMSLSPARAFRAMRIDHAEFSIDGTVRKEESAAAVRSISRLTNGRDRLFLLTIAAMSGFFFALMWWLLGYQRGWWWSPVSALAIIGLSYVEAIGVTWFSSRRAWRVPWHLAERIVCYAAIGWLPAILIMAPLIALHQHAPALPPWARWLPMQGDFRDWIWMVVTAGVAILWFESLVWLGVRKVRFGNAG